MKVTEQNGGTLNLRLNQQGFIDYVHQTTAAGEVEEWWFNYDNDGHLIKMKRTEGGNEVYELIYNGGDVIQTVYTPHENQLNVKQYTYIAYSYDNSQPLYDNIGGVMMFDETLNVDLDEMKYAYMAGMLGKATRHLPCENRWYEDTSDDDGIQYRDIFRWQLDTDDFPYLMTQTSYTDDVLEPYSDSYSFSW